MKINNLRWWVIALIALATVINYIDRSALSVLWPDIVEDLFPDESALERKQIYANISIVFILSYAFGQAIFGKIFDWVGTRLGFVLSIGVWSLATAAHAFAQGALSFSIVRAVLGVAEAGNWPGAARSNASWFPSKERALAQGIFNSGAAIGGIVAIPLIAYLTVYFSSRLKPVINSLVQARIWADAIKNVKSAPYSAIHIDTGMNRLGFSEAEFETFTKNKSLREGVNYEFLMSHLACGGDSAHPMNAQQLSKFKRLSGRLPIGPMSIANTAGIYLGKKYHLQMVRTGIGLFGGHATTDPDQEVTEPVITLMAPVLQIRSVSAGETIGYNAAFIAPKDMTIATVGAGYADGVPVAASGTGSGVQHLATIKGQRTPIVGRVSMDLTILDITRLRKPPRIGDWVEMRGEHMTEDAAALKTIDYELLTRLGQRCRRLYE